jgi:hypothetical protein
MICHHPVVTPANHSDAPIVNERSILGWSGFTSNQLHRIVFDAVDTLKRLESSRKKEQARLTLALQNVSARINSGSPVEDRESFDDYLALVGIPKTNRKKFSTLAQNKEEEQ